MERQETIKYILKQWITYFVVFGIFFAIYLVFRGSEEVKHKQEELENTQCYEETFDIFSGYKGQYVTCSELLD